MKYRVRIDLCFDQAQDARDLMDTGKVFTNVATGPGGTELGFCEFEECRHDEALPCTIIERVEVP